ncbi:Urease accessory protein UreE [Burkholderiales bacterium]|nr:Urease accessory protein UreE [Burkholderiales bacterium]
MLELDRRASRDARPASTLTLPWERRGVTRQKVRLDDGREAGLFLPRGETLRGGDRVASAAGEVVEIVAASEPVMVARAADPQALARAAYHLGNRHVAVEVGEGFLALERDHVLRAMLEGLGLTVEDAERPFEPEGGAYAHGHAHDQGQGHGHGHGRADEGGHGHGNASGGGYDHGHDHAHDPAGPLAARIASPARRHRHGGSHG